MASRTLWIRSSRTLFQTRPFAHSSRVFSKELNERGHSNAEEHRKAQTQRPLNPGLSRDQSAEKADIPKVGKDKAPPELISSVEKNAGQGGSSELNTKAGKEEH